MFTFSHDEYEVPIGHKMELSSGKLQIDQDIKKDSKLVTTTWESFLWQSQLKFLDRF